MKLDHISINVENLAVATAFFQQLGLQISAQWELEGELLETIVGLPNVKTSCVALRVPDSETWIELVTYIHPIDKEGQQLTAANTLGMRHICFAVDHIDDIVHDLQQCGYEAFSAIQRYEERYKLCYVRGPEGIIVELAEKIG